MYKLQKGQSLFELVVAIAISAMVVVAIVSLTVISIKSSSFSKNKAAASSYAQQATEWLRGQRDSNFTEFRNHVIVSGGSDICLNNLVWSFSGCSGAKIDNTIFQRTVKFGFSDGDTVINADVKVSWTDSGGLHDVTSATNFSNWR